MNNDLISRSALMDSFDVCKVTEYDESGCGVDYLAVSVDAIKNAPAVGAVEVVRCKDCVYVELPKCCPYQINGFTVIPEWYCPMGVKTPAEVQDG